MPLTGRHTIKTLAAAYGTAYITMRRQLESLLTDAEIKEEFGDKYGYYFTPKQLHIIEREFGDPVAEKGEGKN